MSQDLNSVTNERGLGGAVVDDGNSEGWWEVCSVARESELPFGKEGGSGSCSEERGIHLPTSTASCGRKKSSRRSSQEGFRVHLEQNSEGTLREEVED